MRGLRPAFFCLGLLVLGNADAADLREDVDADVRIVRHLRALTQVQLETKYTVNQAMAYDFFVPCLDYADQRTGLQAQQAINRDVESDTRNAVVDVYGKLDYHAAYKGRDRLRSRSLDEALRLLTTQINDRSSGKRLLYLCAATTRFERVEVDFDAAARQFGIEYAEHADNAAIFDLPLMRAAAGAQFWPSESARTMLARLAEDRARALQAKDVLRAAFLFAYAALSEPDVQGFIRLSDLATRTAPAESMALGVLLFPRMRLMLTGDAAVQLELIRHIMSRPLPGRRAAEMLPADHLDRITHRATEAYINLPSEHYTPQEYDAALRILDTADLISSEVRELEDSLARDPSGKTYNKRFLFMTYQVQDYRRIVGRQRVDFVRQLQVVENVPQDIDRLLAEKIDAAAGAMLSTMMRAYNPGYRDVWKYIKTEDLARAVVLYERTGDEAFFDLALTAVQATFLSLTDLSIRWQKVRVAARDKRQRELAAESQRSLFGFEPEMMQLLEYTTSIQVDDRPLSRAQIRDIHKRYRDAARRFNNRHSVQKELFRRMPDAQQILAPKPPRLDDILRALRPREAVIYIARVDDDYLRFLITADKTRFVHTRDNQMRVAGLIRRMIKNLVPQPDGGYAEFDSVTSKALYDLTIAPLEPDLQLIDKIVWIGPDALAGLSPEVFTDAKGRLLFDRFSVTLNASLVDLIDSRQVQGTRRDDVLTVLGVGAPQSSLEEIDCLVMGDCPVKESGRRFRGAGSDANQQLKLAPLPETVTELLSLREALDPVEATLLLGPEARVTTVQQGVGGPFDLLAFATHAVPGERLESVGLLEPALLLGHPQEGRAAFLSSSDIAALTLHGAPLVVLSACDTARAGNGSIYFDSMSGFYQAFRLAGAKGVVATQWEVASDAAQRLIPEFVKRARQGETFSEALRNAKINLRDNSPEALQHPGYWMPFAFLGDGGATF